MKKFMLQIIFFLRLKKAIKQAVQANQLSGRKYIVLRLGNHAYAYSKRDLQDLINKRYFKKGTRIQDLERKALFITK